MKQSNTDACTEMVIKAISAITQVKAEKISPDSVLASAPLNIDSFDLVELATEIEACTDIKITPDWFDCVKTVRDVISKIQLEVEN